MLKSYFTTAWRNLWKNKIFSAINIAGLSAGIAFALLIGAYVWNELQVNHVLQRPANQYILTSQWKDPNMGYELATLGPLAKRLKEDYPNLVKNYYRFDGITSVVSKGDKHLRENIQLGDSTLLPMYGFTLLYGKPETALNQPYSVVITETVAIKYFGRKEVLGESLNIQSFSGGNHDFIITGVMKTPAENSVTWLNKANNNTFFIPVANYTFFGRFDPDNWANAQIVSYIELQNGVNSKQLAAAILQLVKLHTTDIVQKNLTVRPVVLTKYYLQKENGIAGRMLFTLSGIGLFLLLMAIVNFINIAISSAGKRIREIGVRKVLGGLRSQLIAQFLAESFILVALATALAIGFYPLASKAFGELVGKAIPSLSFFPWPFIFIPVLLVLLVALLAGIYPAFILSSLKTVDSLKGRLKNVKENVLLRKSLVGFQFFIALVVLIAAGIVTQQVNYFFGRSLGYNKEFVVASQVPRDWTTAGAGKMEIIRNEFARLPQVSDVTLSYEIPNGMNGGQPQVFNPGTDSSKAIPMQSMITDEHYLSAYQIHLKAGAFFSGGRQDSAKIILNEQAILALGYNSSAGAVGQQVRISGDPTLFAIKGITDDFHFGSMQQKIAPIIFFNVQFAPVYRYLSFKIKPGNTAAAIISIQKKWASLLPGSSFEYRFMDDALADIYAAELQLKKAAYVSTLLSLAIMLLGVLGLISLSIHKRVKEIGIRKVLGASVPGIIGLFVKEFILIIIAAAAVAVPVASLLMNNWLNNYAYRISISPGIYLFSILILAMATVLLICLQTVKAALTNPVKSLRTE